MTAFNTTTILRTLAILLFLTLPQILAAQKKNLTLPSPDGKLKVVIKTSDKIYYDIVHDGVTLMSNNRLSLLVDNARLGEEPQVSKSTTSSKNEIIKPIVPLKFSTVTNNYNALVIDFKGDYSVEFRAFNDGAAYRFMTRKRNDIKVNDEEFTISIPQALLFHVQLADTFKTAYEEPYSHLTLAEWLSRKKASTLPVLIEATSKHKILVSESDLTDYPCMFLRANKTNEISGAFPRVPIAFSPDGDRSVKIDKIGDYIAKTSGSRTFPWRYFVIAQHDKHLLENTMTLRLASKPELQNIQWITPGQVSWEWWNGASPYGPDVNFKTGCNLETYKYFIDFAAKFGIKYILLDEGWAMTTTDPFTPNPTVDVHELIRYGKEKNVGIVLWLTWLTVHQHMDLFKTFNTWGVKGVKIDFMDRSDQWMVNYYENVAKEAAKNQLFVLFHGAFKPAGLEYKYPNVLSYEGVRGMEQMGGCTPDNSLYLPFMRNAVGPMDYTPGAMISMQPEVYRAERPNAASIGTRAYQMALFVVFESAVQMLADNPTLYYKNPDCTEFITKVPTTWDETKALFAEAGSLAVVAKRKGSIWFVGGIVNGKSPERQIELIFEFLQQGKTYTMTYFEDGINADQQAMDYRKKTITVKHGDKISIKMVRNGGWAAMIE